MSRQVLRSKRISNIQNIKYDNLIYDIENTKFDNETTEPILYTNDYNNINILNSSYGYINYRNRGSIRIGHNNLYRDVFENSLCIGISNCVNIQDENITPGAGVNDPLFDNLPESFTNMALQSVTIIGSNNYTNNVGCNHGYLKCIGFNNYNNDGSISQITIGNNNDYIFVSEVEPIPLNYANGASVIGNNNKITKTLERLAPRCHIIGSSNNIEIGGYHVIGNNNNYTKLYNYGVEENNLTIGNNNSISNFTTNNIIFGNSNDCYIPYVPLTPDYCINNTVIGNNNLLDSLIIFRDNTIIGSFNNNNIYGIVEDIFSGEESEGVVEVITPARSEDTIIIGNSNYSENYRSSVLIGNLNKLRGYINSVIIGNNNKITGDAEFSLILGNGINGCNLLEYIIINSYSSPYNMTKSKNSKFKILCPFGSNVSSLAPNGKLFYDAIKKKVVYNIK